MTPEQLLIHHGICSNCGELYEHEYKKPFASCKCGTSEWYTLTPYMREKKRMLNAQSVKSEKSLRQEYKMAIVSGYAAHENLCWEDANDISNQIGQLANALIVEDESQE